LADGCTLGGLLRGTVNKFGFILDNAAALIGRATSQSELGVNPGLTGFSAKTKGRSNQKN
jgi:hypothetical protein